MTRDTQIPAPTFPATFVSVSDQVEMYGRHRPGDCAFVEGDRSIDWAGYNDAGDRIAQALVSAGIKKGDRVALLVSNCLWAHELLIGIWRAGAAAVPLSPLMNAEGLATMLEDSGARYMFASNSYVALAGSATDHVNIPLVREGDDYLTLIKTAEPTPTGIELNADDLAVIIYSSGTTGVPKGIAHTHGARLNLAAVISSLLRVAGSSVILSSIPMHSNGAWVGWLPAIYMGATTVILQEFTPDSFVDAVKNHRPTHGFAVPTICALLLERPDIEEVGLDCFAGLVSAGSAMPASVKQRMRELTNHGLFELWGLTEGMATVMTPELMGERPVSVGRPMLGCDIRIIDSEGAELERGGVGEIVGYSSSMMSGYWNRSDANEDVLWKDQTGKLFIRTGDVGEMDADGFLMLRGRIKEMVISGGQNVYPIDLETVLLENDSVADATVVGVEHPKWGETPVAFVILDADSINDADAIKDWANERLSKHQRLHDVVIHQGDFPRNTLGKVLKAELASSYKA
ncbi:MAG: class I adenylate-forming enzyme family protein [Parasphingorhabdus sp.]